MEQWIKMSAPSSALVPGGALWELGQILAVQGLSHNTKTTPSTGITRSEILLDAVTVAQVVAVESCRDGLYWGQVESWPCWLLMNSAELDDVVLEGLPNREDGAGQIRTWATWHNPATHTGPRLSLDGTLALVATNGFGRDLEGKDVLALAEAGFEIKSQSETGALQADPAWTEAGHN